MSHPLRVAVVPGSSQTMVARSDDVLLVVDRSVPGRDEGYRTLLRLVRDAADIERTERPRALGRQALRLLSPGSDTELPSFGLAIVAEDGVAVMLYGEVTVTWTNRASDDQMQLSGHDAFSGWVERLIPHPIEGVVMGRPTRSPPAVEPPGELVEGVVPGDGLSIRPRTEPRNDQDQVAVVAGEQLDDALTTAPIDVPGPDETAGPPLDEARQPSPVRPPVGERLPPPPPSPTTESPPPPVTGSTPSPETGHDDEPSGFVIFNLDERPASIGTRSIDADPAPAGVKVEGLRCSRGHFNHPRASYCNLCGIGLLQVTTVPVSGDRPPLGIVIVDDGATFTLDADYIIGRDPSAHRDVVAGRARALRLDDVERRISRFHAELRLQGWEVVLTDQGSTNGTFVLAPERPDWQLVLDGRQQALTHGTRVSLGGRSFTYRSHHVTS